MPEEAEYLEVLKGIRTWVCAIGHCCWEGDYMLIEGGEIMECPVKMMFDSVNLHEHLELDTLPDDEGECPYLIQGFAYTEGVLG